MAINIKNEKRLDKDVVIIELENGHAEALAKITKDYKLIGEKEAVNFILSVMAQAEGKPVKVNDVNFMPSEKIIKSQQKNV